MISLHNENMIHEYTRLTNHKTLLVMAISNLLSLDAFFRESMLFMISSYYNRQSYGNPFRQIFNILQN